MGISTDAVLLLGNDYHEMKSHIEKAVGYIPPEDENEVDEDYDFYELIEQFEKNTGIELYAISYDAYIEDGLIGVLIPLQLSSIGLDLGFLEINESNLNMFKDTIAKEHAELRKHLPDAPLQLRVTPWVT